MRKLWIVLLVVLVTLPALSQSAKVIQLSPDDAHKARELHDAVEKAQKAEADFRYEVEHKYLVVTEGDPDAGSYSATYNLAEFSNGAAFISADSTITVNQYGDIRASNECDPDVQAKKKAAQERYDQWKREHPSHYYRRGWGDGKFDYSEDFKFIVSAPERPIYSNGSIMLTPSQGWQTAQ